MTNNEVKEAWLKQVPVIHQRNDLEAAVKYKCISAIICRLDKDGEIDLTAELECYSGHSRTLADPKHIRLGCKNVSTN